MTFLAYAVTRNTDETHELRFLGKFDAEPHEDAVEHECDGLLARVTQNLARSSEAPDADGWDLEGYEAILAFPEEGYWQINAPQLRGVRLGFGTSSSNPRRMRVRL